MCEHQDILGELLLLTNSLELAVELQHSVVDVLKLLVIILPGGIGNLHEVSDEVVRHNTRVTVLLLEVLDHVLMVVIDGQVITCRSFLLQCPPDPRCRILRYQVVLPFLNPVGELTYVAIKGWDLFCLILVGKLVLLPVGPFQDRALSDTLDDGFS